MRIHFIGIGGIGVSALALYYAEKGHKVSGSDLARSEITQALKQKGAKIKIGPHKPENILSRVDLVIHSPAVTKQNPELQYAKSLLASKSFGNRWEAYGKAEEQMRVLSYPEALGELTKQHYTIAVSGTHGKSTTTAMLSLLLIEAGFDPTCIVGTKVREFDLSLPSGSNCRVGQGTFQIHDMPVLVIEADEHFASFLHYSPDIIVLTSVEPDHLDYYKNLKNIIKAFKEYVGLLPKKGIIVANKDDENIREIVRGAGRKIQWYSARQKAAKELRTMLKVPGEYNVANAHAALTTARALDIPDETSVSALSKFQGTWRRFEIFKLTHPVPYTLVSDYGHHPTEVRVTVEAARAWWPKEQLWLVFQPHQYERTLYFYRDFIAILTLLPVDRLIVTEIYDVAGREHTNTKEKVSAEKLVAQIQRKKGKQHAQNVLYMPSATVQQYLSGSLQGGEVVMVMGAGDIYNVTMRLTRVV